MRKDHSYCNVKNEWQEVLVLTRTGQITCTKLELRKVHLNFESHSLGASMVALW